MPRYKLLVSSISIFSLFFYTYFYTNSVDVFKKFDAKVKLNVNVREIVILILFS